MPKTSMWPGKECAEDMFIGNAKNGRCSGVTLLELIIAISMVTIVFAVLIPQFSLVRNSWDSKQGSAEAMQNGRVLAEHFERNLGAAVKVAAVSESSDTDGYIEFEDNDGNVMRYDTDGGGYVEFGAVGAQSDLAGPVNSLRFSCYDACDLDTALSPVGDTNEVRFVKMEAMVINSAMQGNDKRFLSCAYLRANGNPDSGGSCDAVADAFGAVSFAGNDGTVNWTNNWQEYLESDGPTQGLIRVRSNDAESTNAIDITTALFSTRVAWRECDLSGTGSATLTFDYEFSGFFGSGDVLIYDGSDWNPVESYSLGGNSSGSEEIDISAYLDSQSRVGFMVSGGFAVMGFDNVQVEYGDSCGGAIIP